MPSLRGLRGAPAWIPGAGASHWPNRGRDALAPGASRGSGVDPWSGSVPLAQSRAGRPRSGGFAGLRRGSLERERPIGPIEGGTPSFRGLRGAPAWIPGAGASHWPNRGRDALAPGASRGSGVDPWSGSVPLAQSRAGRPRSGGFAGLRRGSLERGRPIGPIEGGTPSLRGLRGAPARILGARASRPRTARSAVLGDKIVAAPIDSGGHSQ